GERGYSVMPVNEYGGIIIRSVDNAGKKVIFADNQYSYYLFKLAAGECLRVDKLSSFSIFVLNTDDENALFVRETGLTLNRGDMVQAENSAVSLEGRAPQVMLLISGINKSCAKDKEVNRIRHKDIYRVTKPWGHELWINGEHPGYALKEVKIKAGTRTSLQYHRYKYETNVIFSGRANIHYKKETDKSNDDVKAEDIGSVNISPITSVEVRPDTLHRVEALTDIVLYETSTPHLDDVIRIQDDTARDNGRIVTEHGRNL
ncbi:MAG: hypothetical protein ABIA63_15355, partial [bacterium]